MCAQCLEINILKAYHGDCIHLRFGPVDNEAEQTEKDEKTETPKAPAYNIVIDSGPGMHLSGFRKLMNGIDKAGESVDLLCFTHMDDDHTLAAKHYFNTNKKLDFIKQIWINIPKDEAEHAKKLKAGSVELTGAKKTFELFGHILWHKIPYKTEVKQGHQAQFGDMVLRVEGPTQDRLDRYFAEWDKQMNTVLTDAKSEDDSDANGGSIVIVVEAMGKKLLFSGDAFASDLEAVSGECAGEEGFVLVKLPHHGSNANMSLSMLEKMNCKNFVISANGSMDRPAQKTVDILGEYGSLHEGVVLYGNYDWGRIKKEIAGLRIVELEAEPVSVAEGITLRTE